jgi:hypothetical protein
VVLSVIALAVALPVLFATTGLVDWTDRYAATVQAGAVTALVVVTVMYMFYTRDLVVKTRQQGGPYAFVEVVRRGGLVEAAIRNTGKRGAENIRVDVLQDVKWEAEDDRGFLGWPLFTSTIPFLPPDGVISQTISNLQSVGPALGRLEPKDRVIRYRISYRDQFDEYWYEREYDLSFLVPVGGDPFPDAGNDLALLRRDFDRWAQAHAGKMDKLRDAVQAVATSLGSLSARRGSG